MHIKCPECGSELDVPDNHPTRPFCSPRCKLLDLGHWFNEEYHVPVPLKELALSEELTAELERAGLSPEELSLAKMALDEAALDEPPPELTVDLDRYRIPEA